MIISIKKAYFSHYQPSVFEYSLSSENVWISCKSLKCSGISLKTDGLLEFYFLRTNPPSENSLTSCLCRIKADSESRAPVRQLSTYI